VGLFERDCLFGGFEYAVMSPRSRRAWPARSKTPMRVASRRWMSQA
jgi:hypothetical protein